MIVTSVPIGADVYRDGEFVGATPYSMTRPDGDARVGLEVRLDGYATGRATVSAITGETLAYVEERRKITPPGGNRIDSFSMPTSSVTVWADISRWARSAASRLRSGLEKAQKG